MSFKNGRKRGYWSFITVARTAKAKSPGRSLIIQAMNNECLYYITVSVQLTDQPPDIRSTLLVPGQKHEIGL